MEKCTEGSEDTFLYFGYGSNLLKERIQLNNASAVFIEPAELKDYRLCFGGQPGWRSKRWQGGVATVEQADGRAVWGTVWRMSKSDMKHLDIQENEGTIYRSLNVTVTSRSGATYDCRTYQLMDLVEIQPSPQYLEIITRGAQQSGLPDDYLRHLHSIEHNGFQGDVTILDSINAKCRAPDLEDTFLYFAFGSNMLKARIHINNPSAELVSAARLEDYRLGFGLPSNYDSPEDSVWKGCAATITSAPGHHVWGIMWRLQRSDLPHLDRQENNGEAYQGFEVTVKTPDDRCHKCRTYQLIEPFREGLASPQYLKVMIEGAKQNGIPQDYVDTLCLVKHNGYSGKVPIMEKLF